VYPNGFFIEKRVLMLRLINNVYYLKGLDPQDQKKEEAVKLLLL